MNSRTTTTPTRREFIQYSMATGAAAVAAGSLTPWALAQANGNSGKNLKILVLGGTRFLGPALVEAARARGHELTLFNRGRSNDDMYPEIQTLYGDRDPNSPDQRNIDAGEEPRWGEGDGLKSIADAIADGQTWDACIDTSGYVPRIVKASAELLAPVVSHYTFISSVSVYSGFAEPGRDETAEVGTLDDPTVEQVNGQTYGPLKALCEQAATEAMNGRAANVRPGLIVGPRDGTDRFTYWPVRVSKGGDVLTPGTPNDPIQIIDVRDLAEFNIHLIEQNTTGDFNAIGPAPGELTIGKMLDSCKRVSGSDAAFHWAPADFLQENGVTPWGNMPVWIPPEGDSAGFHMWDVAKPVAAGMRFRPIDDTVGATLAWWKSLTDEERADHPMNRTPPRAGISAERESELLAKLAEA